MEFTHVQMVDLKNQVKVLRKSEADNNKTTFVGLNQRIEKQDKPHNYQEDWLQNKK